jgi:glycosyltransferase involved in cell wall biosynthesis
VRDDLIEFRIAPPVKIVTVPLGLDLAPFAAQSRGGAKPAVGIVGRLVPIKNHALFLRLARRLIAEGFDGDFVIVGDGELRAALEREAADLDGRLTFTGWRRDLPQVYAGLSVVVNTSLNEGTPVALIEAMAAGTPVVATAVGGVPDLIRHGETGWLASNGDVAALAEGVKSALRDDGTVAHRAQIEVLRGFSTERLIADVERLYETLIAKSQIPSPNFQH